MIFPDPLHIFDLINELPVYLCITDMTGTACLINSMLLSVCLSACPPLSLSLSLCSFICRLPESISVYLSVQM